MGVAQALVNTLALLHNTLALLQVQSDLKIHNAFFRNKCYEPVNNYIDTPGA